ncbi:hypothetical protein TRIP_B40018 [uncultured Desulfatiglans sp.]|nr:hypothetical protein TRIP_B40018 [uncultured Desulfatiglans sp.]
MPPKKAKNNENVTQEKGLSSKPKPLFLLVPEVGIEPTWTQGPLDFESSASTSFTTPAFNQKIIIKT